MKTKLLILVTAALSLAACQKPAAPVATVSRSMNGTTTTTYHDPNEGFHTALSSFFTP